MPVGIIIVEKSGTLKLLNVKDFNETELYKKCGFKKSDGFDIQTEWNVKLNGQKYVIVLYAKKDGRAGLENKYDFPPPVDTTLFFGSCLLVGYLRDDLNNRSLFSLTLDLWEKIYEKLFGGFEDITNSNDDEEDELENIPQHAKTKVGGYLKDGFVVDDSNEELYSTNSDNISDYETCSEDNEAISNNDNNTGCSELSEETYDYSDDEN